MSKKFVFLLMSVLVFPALLLAQTGKISGTVTDRETNEPLPGANVILQGTTLGATSDLNGEFTILNVPIGSYSVQARFIGYSNVTIKNVIVNSGLTTKLEFDLPAEALEVGSVTIVAERPLINKNATNAVRIQSYEEFKNIPTRQVNSILALQPGVLVQDGNMYIRGGRRDEVGYYLEGATTRDIISGNNVVTVIPEALAEFQVQAGGYTARYGGANAGIVTRTLRSGTPDYHFSLQGETDNFANSGDKFLDTYSYGYSDYTLTASGPVPFLGEKFKFFFAGENEFYRDRTIRFWKGFDFNNASTFIDNNNFPLVTTTYNDTISQGLHMKDGYIPNTSSERWTGNGTLVWDNNPFVVRLGGSLTWERTRRGSQTNPASEILNSNRIGIRDLSDALVNLKFTHILSPNTFYEVNLNYHDRRYHLYDPLMKDNFYTYWDSLANAQYGYDFLSYSSGRAGNDIDVYGFDFDIPGTPSNYQKDKRQYFGGSLNLTTQMGSHELELGGDYQYWTTRHFDVFERGMFTTHLDDPDEFRNALAGDPKAYGELMAGAGNNATYGYDIFGNELDSDTFGKDGPRHPFYGSFYIQDKFEARDLVINAGLRLDAINNDDFRFRNPRDPAWDPELHILEVDSLQKVDTFYQLSPRLGFAFPATENTVFHLQYGKFIQAPSLTNLYAGERFYDQIFTGGFAFLAPYGFNLDPIRTTQYEIGFSHQFSNRASFDMTAFYRDIKGQLQVSRVSVDPTSRSSVYNILQNGDFATTRGLEFSLTLRRTNRVQAQINYTFSSALGTGSVPNQAVAGIEQGTALPTTIQPLNYNQPHVGSVNFDYRFGQDDGGPILERSGLNLLFTFSSGHPYTLARGAFGQQDVSYGGVITDPRNRFPQEAINSSMTPWDYDISLRLDKTVDMGPFDANFYVYVQNLTNRRNVINVYERTGNPWDDGFLTNPDLSSSIINANGGQKYIALYNAINLNGNGTNARDQYNVGNYLFGQPRQIRFGVRFEY